MTETDSQTPETKPRRSMAGLILVLLVLVLIGAGLFVSAYFLPGRTNLFPLAETNGIVQGDSADLERRVKALEVRTGNLDSRISDLVSSPASPSDQSESKVPAQDIVGVKSDLAALTATVGNLQNEVRQTNATVQKEAQSLLFRMISYMQLRDAVHSGRGFARELEAMRAAAGGDAGFKEQLDKMAPHAEKGVATISVLRTQLLEQIHAAQVATAKAEAQTWWQRFLAELRGLVSVRSVREQAAPDDLMTGMYTALGQEDLAAALETMKNLPPSAQEVLNGWRQQAEARQMVNQALHETANRLVTGLDLKTAPVKPVDSAKPVAPAETIQPDGQEETP